jgi:hypothetical protein
MHEEDAQAAIRALLQSVLYLEAERDRALVLVSYGCTRWKIEYVCPAPNEMVMSFLSK